MGEEQDTWDIILCLGLGSLMGFTALVLGNDEGRALWHALQAECF